MRRSTQRCFETRAVQVVWETVHSRTSDRRAHGFLRGLMRSILQLRVPEVARDQNRSRDEYRGLIREALAENSPAVRFRDPQIEMAHGAGGKASRRLVEGVFAPLLFPGSEEPLGDAARVAVNGASIAFTTDSFVVKPLRFPGGSIGELAVNGTMNDLAVSGARGCAIVVTFVLEEGLATV